jgi:hypothetical protein
MYYCTNISTDGIRHEGSLQGVVCGKKVLNPQGQPIDVAYLEKTFGGEIPFKGNEIDWGKFSNGNTAVVPQDPGVLMHVPEDASAVQHMEQTFRSHAKPFSFLQENLGSYRMWSGSDTNGNLLKPDRSRDEMVDKTMKALLAQKPSSEAPAQNEPQEFQPVKEAVSSPSGIPGVAPPKTLKTVGKKLQEYGSKYKNQRRVGQGKDMVDLGTTIERSNRQASTMAVLLGWAKQKNQNS